MYYDLVLFEKYRANDISSHCFRYLNISRNCGKASVFDTCGCDYVWIYEPPIEDASGEQFCGRFIQNNASELNYISQTRTVALTFIYSREYGQAFALDYFSTSLLFSYLIQKPFIVADTIK